MKLLPNKKRNFKAKKPNQKLAIGVTEFTQFGTKLYLLTITDLYSRKVVSYNLSYRPYGFVNF